MLCHAPVWLRWDGETLWMVSSGASPIGEDHVRIRVWVDPGVTATLRSVAATVVYAANGGGTRWDTEIHVAEGAVLGWHPEPLILTQRALHSAITVVHAAAGSEVILDDIVVFGRANEPGGILRSTLAVSVDDDPVLLTSMDTSIPKWLGPGGTNGAKVIAQRLRVGVDNVGIDNVGIDTGMADGHSPTMASEPLRSALLQPAPGCQLSLTAADDPTTARRNLTEITPNNASTRC